MSRNIPLSSSLSEGLHYHQESNTSFGKLLITCFHDKCCAMLHKDNRLLAIQVLPEGPALGSVYMGRVKDLADNLNACFVQITENDICFLKYQNIPKEYFPLKQGALIPVSLFSEAQKNKRPQVTAKIPWTKIPNGKELKETCKHKSAFHPIYAVGSKWDYLFHHQILPEEFDEIVINLTNSKDSNLSKTENLHKELLAYMEALSPEHPLKAKPLRTYQDASFPLEKLYALETKVADALNRQFWLKSGGYVVLDQTEALYVFDVNSGKFEPSKSGSLRESILKVNMEAADEIALQLRLRSLSGMILIDFINMDNDEDKQALMDHMTEISGFDVCKVQVLDYTALGIMEITRQKKWRSLAESGF